jgi:hypothetical protein
MNLAQNRMEMMGINKYTQKKLRERGKWTEQETLKKIVYKKLL